MHLNSNMKQSS